VFCPFKYPLYILERHFVVMWNKEALHRSTESLIEVKNSTVHVNKNHIVVEQEPIDNGKSKDYEDSKVDSY
jgi:hypothetical protein